MCSKEIKVEEYLYGAIKTELVTVRQITVKQVDF